VPRSKARRRPLLDHLCARFPETERESLYAFVVCGDVYVAGERVTNPKQAVPVDAVVELRSASRPVGRGAEKLAAALEALDFPVAQRVVLDAGSSTGGFVQTLLERGASSVHAVDVGTNQLDYRLRRDRRVFVHERTNVFDLTPGDLTPAPDIATADLSFRSLRRAASYVCSLVTEGQVLALAKPQFEIGRTPNEHATGGEGGGARSAGEFAGVVDDDRVAPIIDALCSDLEAEGLRVLGRVPSPIRGREGNQEVFLLLAQR